MQLSGVSSGVVYKEFIESARYSSLLCHLQENPS